MKKEDFEDIRKSIINTLENLEYKEDGITPVGSVGLDEGDIANEIGISFGEIMIEKGLDKWSFIHGIKHGLSLKDGTH